MIPPIGYHLTDMTRTIPTALFLFTQYRTWEYTISGTRINSTPNWSISHYNNVAEWSVSWFLLLPPQTQLLLRFKSSFSKILFVAIFFLRNTWLYLLTVRKRFRLVGFLCQIRSVKSVRLRIFIFKWPVIWTKGLFKSLNSLRKNIATLLTETFTAKISS